MTVLALAVALWAIVVVPAVAPAPRKRQTLLDTVRRFTDTTFVMPILALAAATAALSVLRRFLPMADEGLRRWEVPSEVRDRYLGVIEGRVKTGRNGSAWQVSTVRALQECGLTPQRAGRDAAAVLPGCTARRPSTPGTGPD